MLCFVPYITVKYTFYTGMCCDPVNKQQYWVT